MVCRRGAPHAACLPDRAGPVAGGVRGDARRVPRVVSDVGCRAASNAAEDTRTRPCAGDASRRPRTPSVPVLALLIGVHVKTLRAAARDGRLPVTYDTRTTFRRLRARATHAAGTQFRRAVLWPTGSKPADRRTPLTWASVPEDYDVQIRALRRARGLSQAQLATLVGAAHKAVVYQWEARTRTPSPLFWQRIAALRVPALRPAAAGARPQEHLRYRHVVSIAKQSSKTSRLG